MLLFSLYTDIIKVYNLHIPHPIIDIYLNVVGVGCMFFKRPSM